MSSSCVRSLVWCTLINVLYPRLLPEGLAITEVKLSHFKGVKYVGTMSGDRKISKKFFGAVDNEQEIRLHFDGGVSLKIAEIFSNSISR